MEQVHLVALSGGKDSTALALRLAELHPDAEYTYLCTPTGDELPEMVAHWDLLETRLGRPLIRIQRTGGLRALIEHYDSLPNNRQRWCTRQLKIQPCLAWIRAQSLPVTLYVGLRADEEERQGIYSSEVTTKFPLREWGWGVKEVLNYVKSQGIVIPKRTDCARCYDQRLPEWWSLWKNYPEIYEDAAAQERATGHTFRSPSRDTWPASLDELKKRFDAGDVPRGTLKMLQDQEEGGACRVCRL